MSGIRAPRSHSPVDLAQWYRSHGEAVLYRCRRLVGSSAKAEDVLQEVFLRAHRYRKTYRGGSPLSWLLTIADRCAYDVLKSAKREPISDDEVMDLQSAGQVPNLMQQLLVQKFLARVDERTALIVIRRYFDEMTLDQIAAELDLNERTVRRHLQRFLDKTRTFVRSAEIEHA